jgi:hypothetical protein
VGDRCLTQPTGKAQDSEPDLRQVPIDVAGGAIAKRTPPEPLAFIGICRIDQDSSDLVMRVKSLRHLTMSTIAPIVHPDSIPVNLQSVSPMRSRAEPTTREC